MWGVRFDPAAGVQEPTDGIEMRAGVHVLDRYRVGRLAVAVE